MNTASSLIRSIDSLGAPLLALLALRATVVLGLAWVVVKSWGRVSSAVRYCVWQFALTGLLLLPAITVLLPGIPLGFSLGASSRQLASADGNLSSHSGLLPQPALDEENRAFQGWFSDVSGGLHESASAREGNTAQAAPTLDDSPIRGPRFTEFNPARSIPGRVSWSLLGFGIWALGVAVHLALLARSAFRARQLVRGAQPLPEEIVEQRLRGCERQVSATSRPRLLASAETSVPVVIGVLRPCILLPLDSIEWSADRWRMVLAHELAHVERRDVFWQLVARTVAAFYWYHPLVWLAVRGMRHERERACDDRVLAAGVQPVDYAAGLVEVAAALKGWPHRLAGGLCMAERCQLEERVRSILDPTAMRRPASIRVRRGIFLVAVCVVFLLGMLRPFSPIQDAAAESLETHDQLNAQTSPLEVAKAALPPIESRVEANVQDARARTVASVSIPPQLPAASNVIVERNELSAADSKPFIFQVALPKSGDISLKVFDANGKFVRLLSQKYVAEKQMAVFWDLKDSGGNPVAPGAYTVRVESGLRLIFDNAFAKDGLLEDKALKSPGVLRVDKQGNLYLLDIAASTLAKYNSDGDASNQETVADAIGTTTLFKFDRDGNPVKEWNGKNTIAAPHSPYWGGLAVESDGSRIYLSETFTANHIIHVYDGKIGTRLFSIGGFCGEDVDWEKEKGGIVDPWWLGLNGDMKLYTVSGERFCAFDRRQEGKAGAVWQLGGKANPRPGWDSAGDAGDTDGASAIYLASIYYHHRKELFKVVDTGESCRFAYDIRRYLDPQTNKEVELSDICGVAYDGEKALWVIERAGARIVKIADSGTSLDFVAAFGSRGKDAARLEFVAPRGAAVSPDGKLLYVIEDGEPVSKTDNTTGQARVTRYKIDYSERDVLRLTVRP